jgi:hypothetical protein
MKVSMNLVIAYDRKTFEGHSELQRFLFLIYFNQKCLTAPQSALLATPL